MLPSWIAYSIDPLAVMQSPMVIQPLLGLAFYLLLALLFSTTRRRNGFAAVQDLLTKTRVISKASLELRPVLAAAEPSPTAVDDKSLVGPYHVLETLETDVEGQWLLGYDLRLLRKVWIRTVRPGTPPVPAALRNIGRIGRLRWLTGRRTPEENWDAFEGVGGQPLLRLIQDRQPRRIEGDSPIFAHTKIGTVPQPWSKVRFWLYDLAREIGAAEKDGTLPPVLALDRVWITGDGRAKLLDFPAPGLATDGGDHAGAMVAAPPLPEAERPRRFLGDVAVAALAGRVDVAARTTDEPAVPLPLHARSFLEQLPQFPDADAVVGGLQPLLRRVTSVSRWRRAAVVVGCIVPPLLMSLFMTLGMNMIEKTYPGLVDLSNLMRMRQSKHYVPGHTKITDRQFAVFIASHYRALVADDASWNSPIVLSLVNGDDRRFAEESVAEHPAPTAEEVAEADAALKPYLDKFAPSHEPHPILMTVVLMGVYVCVPALLAALLFRGGLLLRMAGVAFVGRDGKRATRWGVFRRVFVAWCPLCLVPAIIVVVKLISTSSDPALLSGWPPVLYFGLYCGLAILSAALPERGLPDRLAGIWPVPR